MLSIYVDYGRAFPGESLLKLIVNEEIGSTLVAAIRVDGGVVRSIL